MTTVMTDRAHWDRVHQALHRMYTAPCEITVLLGADELHLEGPGAVAMERERRRWELDAVDLMRVIVERRAMGPAELLAGVRFTTTEDAERDGVPPFAVTVRQASLEESAEAVIRRLRGADGTHLRRQTADAMARTVERVLERARQPVRGVPR